MLSIQDFIDNCRLTADEVDVVAKHELVTDIIALEMEEYLCVGRGGERFLSNRVVDDIHAARRHGNRRHAATLRLVRQHFLERHAGVALTDEQKRVTGSKRGVLPAFGESLLLTDLYQFNMLQAYRDAGMDQTAVFEFFVRRLPKRRGFLFAAGVTSVFELPEHARFSQGELSWVRASGRLTGDVDAMDAGRLFFPDEPVLRVIAPISQAQLVESRVINLLHFQTVVASKAVRFVLAAPGKTLINFGLRRAHSAEAGLLAARSAYLAGFAGSATTLVEKRFGVPAYGSMAHSFIQAHDSEEAAFDRFGKSMPKHAIYLIDTYETARGAEKVVKQAKKGLPARGLRLDNGDLAKHARTVRAILDASGLGDVRIFASGGLDEDRLTRHVADDVPIDGYGIGTSLTTSEDAPALDCAYKLQEYDGRPKRKRSEGKATWPGRKQVYRHYGSDGMMTEDVLTLADCSNVGEPLLQPILLASTRIEALPSLEEVRRLATDELARLPQHLRTLKTKPAYLVHFAPELRKLAAALDQDTM